jgi:hypothetical protein
MKFLTAQVGGPNHPRQAYRARLSSTVRLGRREAHLVTPHLVARGPGERRNVQISLSRCTTATRAIGQSTAGRLGPRRRAQRSTVRGKHWIPARPSPHPTHRRTSTTSGLLWPLPSSASAARCWLPNHRYGVPPGSSRTPPTSGIRGDICLQVVPSRVYAATTPSWGCGGYTCPAWGAGREARINEDRSSSCIMHCMVDDLTKYYTGS